MAYFEYNKKKVSYQDEGEGKVILLVHGFLESLHMWEETSAYLSHEYRVVRIDLPGHGKSELLNETLEMDDAAELIVTLLQALNIKEVVCVGHSMGGYVCLALADLFPKMIKGLVLFHSHGMADSPEAKINRGRAIHIVKENHKNFISHFIPDLFTEENRNHYSEEISLLQLDAQLMQKEGVIASLSGMRNRPDRRSVFKNSEFRIGFIIGQQDIRIDVTEVLEQARMCNVSQILLLKDVAHMGYIEDFEQTSAFLRSFAENTFK